MRVVQARDFQDEGMDLDALPVPTKCFVATAMGRLGVCMLLRTRNGIEPVSALVALAHPAKDLYVGLPDVLRKSRRRKEHHVEENGPGMHMQSVEGEREEVESEDWNVDIPYIYSNIDQNLKIKVEKTCDSLIGFVSEECLMHLQNMLKSGSSSRRLEWYLNVEDRKLLQLATLGPFLAASDDTTSKLRDATDSIMKKLQKKNYG